MGLRGCAPFAALLALVVVLGGCAVGGGPGLKLVGGVHGEHTLTADDEGWTPVPTEPDPAFLEAARTECLDPSGGQDPAGTVLQDQRGPDRAAFLWTDELGRLCVIERSDAGLLGLSVSSTIFPGDPGPISLDRGWWAYPTVVSGSVDADTTAVDIVTVRGLSVRATSGAGRFVAWWPGDDPPHIVRSLGRDGDTLAVLQVDPFLPGPGWSEEPWPTEAPGMVGPQRVITASHILFAPLDDPDGAPYLPPADPAWTVAEAQARVAADRLRAIDDPDVRVAAFAEMAKAQGDDASAPDGGFLGPFTREDMVPEFADPIFDAPSPKPGDIIGPVRTEFGWHVVLYQGESMEDPDER